MISRFSQPLDLSHAPGQHHEDGGSECCRGRDAKWQMGDAWDAKAM